MVKSPGFSKEVISAAYKDVHTHMSKVTDPSRYFPEARTFEHFEQVLEALSYVSSKIASVTDKKIF